MALLIDGYNLLYVSGIVGRGIGPGGLHRSRMALLNFLAESLADQELNRTTIVFDSHDAPRTLPQRLEHRGITVRFAAKYESADELIEELIRADSSPRRLVVVSSDHRVQRAAKRRRAKAVDSDVWFNAILHERRERREQSTAQATKPAVPLLTEDVDYWLRQFGGESELTKFLQQECGAIPKQHKNTPRPSADAKAPDDNDAKCLPDAHDNPFPPGYGEDLLKDGAL